MFKTWYKRINSGKYKKGMKEIFKKTLDQNNAGRENVWRKLSYNELGHSARNSNMKNNEIELNIEAALGRQCNIF